MEKFKTSDEFFDWYLATIESYAPDYKAILQKAFSDPNGGSSLFYELSQKFPKLTKEQMDFMFAEIRRIFKVRSNVYLVYDSKTITYYSRYNPTKKRLEIGCPTTTYWHLRYPPVIIAAMQHEMGHILNRDYKVNIPNHVGCVNRCMDIRINHHIDREMLRDLFNAVYYFKEKKHFNMLVPEDTIEDYGMRLKTYGTYSWEQIHKMYHFNDSDPKEKKPEKPMEYKLPEVGDIVMINASNKYGQVVEVEGDKVEVVEITAEQVNEHFKNIAASGGGGYDSVSK